VGEELSTALKRGTLEYCVLALLARRERYGVELVRHLGEGLGMPASEGTLYPLLSRLRRSGKVSTTWRDSPVGPPRRYYVLTPTGAIALDQFKAEWISFRSAMDKMLAAESS